MEFSELMQKRRSITFFDKNKPLDEALLKSIISEALLAPSANNLQPFRVIALTSQDAKETLYKHAFKQEKILTAPVTLLIVADKEGYREDNPAWDQLKETDYDHFERSLRGAKKLYAQNAITQTQWAQSNAGLFAMAIMLCAENKGVMSHPMSGLKFDELQKAFRFKESEHFVMAIALGYKDDSKTLYARLKRKNITEILEIL